MEALPDPNDPGGRKYRPFRDNPEARMTFIEHLGELRTRIVRSSIAILIGLIFAYAVSDYIITAIASPLLGEGSPFAPLPEGVESEMEDAAPKIQADWVTLNPIEGVLVRLKIALYAGIFLSLPFVLYQGCAFIFPGLRPSERRLVQVLLSGCAVLGIAGVIVAYFLVFPLVLPYLAKFSPEFVRVQLRMSETISLLLKGFVGFAIAFQFPMAVLVLVRLDLLTPKTLREQRKIAIVIIFGLSMLLTPPDPVSMVIMAGPLVLLYEGSIWASYLVQRRKKEPDQPAT